jgi:hypothetical protein
LGRENLGVKINVFVDRRSDDPNVTIPIFWETLIRDDNITIAKWIEAAQVVISCIPFCSLFLSISI